MVVICLPATGLTGTWHDRVATPSICTVQAPHWAMPQPYLVPVRPSVSRNTHKQRCAQIDIRLIVLTVDVEGHHLPSSRRAPKGMICSSRADGAGHRANQRDGSRGVRREA